MGPMGFLMASFVFAMHFHVVMVIHVLLSLAQCHPKTLVAAPAAVAVAVPVVAVEVVAVVAGKVLVMFPVAVVQRRRRFVRLLFKLVLHDVGAVEGRSRKSTPPAWRNM